jgi:S1-C subfamily serine protease
MIECSNPDCGRRVSARIAVCPDCGAILSRPDRAGGFALIECVAESRTASIYRASKDGDSSDVCLRLYNADVFFSPGEAGRLRTQFEALRELPADRFIHTLDFGHDDTLGRWYRVTLWLPNVMAWGDLKSAALYRDPERKRQWLALALDLAESFAEFHRIGRVIPDFTLDDCLLYRAPDGRLRVRLDATLASCLGPGSGREKVRDRHPDFAPGHALSEQSDVWTLGAILVSMLAGTTDMADYAHAMDSINAERRPVAVHPELGTLLRQMVDPDPAERPRGMKSVCERLRAFGPEDIAEWNRIERDPWRQSQLFRRLWGTIAIAAVAVAALVVFLYRNTDRISERHEKTTGDLIAATRKQLSSVDVERKAQAVLERYGRSVAFVLTEVWLEVDGKRISLSTASGTAFLVSADGYLLSNRHVVAPWLSGETAVLIESQLALLRQSGKPFRFGASRWLWFDGAEAFRNQSAVPPEGAQVADIYRLDTAYTDAGENPRLRVVGVMPMPTDPAEFLASTLKDDVAVLKVEGVPSHAIPIPLSVGEPPPRGAGLLVLGYSQGRGAIPGTRALARATRGASSGTLGDVLTTDADIQPGNSGGPVFDLDGSAVGIASALLSADGRLETSMGRVLPIETARQFLEAMRAGRPAWDGLLEAAFEPELVTARKAAEDGDWDAARALVKTQGVLANPDVALKAAVYCMDKDGFTAEGRAALDRVMEMTPHFPFAALLRYWDAWRRGVPPSERPCRRELLEAEWWSPFEPYGYVARLLDGGIGFEQASLSAESQVELTLYHWAAGTVAARDGLRARAAVLLRAGLADCHPDDTVTRNLLSASLWFECGEGPVAGTVETNNPPQFRALEESFAALVAGDWPQAASAIDRHFETPRRESSNTLGLGLFRAQLHGLMGDPAAEKEAIEAFRDRIANPWYRQIADVLLGNTAPDALLATVAGKRPETLTLAVALGLQAEARKDKPRALGYYRTALDTAQTNWLEFQIAQARRKALK